MTFLLTFALLVNLLPVTTLAANNTATTMRLEKAEGSVTVTNSTAKELTRIEDLRLYNGYRVKTGAKSYAWTSLDDTKVAKLDANSAVEVQKSGNNLAINAATLVNNADLVIKDSVGGGTVTGSVDLLISNGADGTLTWEGGGMTATYAGIANSGTFIMEGGSLSASSGAVLQVVGGTVILQGGSITADAEGVNAIAVTNGAIDSNNPIGTTVKALAEGAVITPANKIPAGCVVEREGNYYVLEQGPSAAELAEMQTIFVDQLIVYDSTGTARTIPLRTDLLFDGELMHADWVVTRLDSSGLPLDELVVYSENPDAEALTIDLQGNDLILNTTLYLASYAQFKITDSVGGGKITGTAGEMILNGDEATLTLDAVEMEVTGEGQMGINNVSWAGVTLTDSAVLTVKGAGAVGIMDQAENAIVPDGCIIVEGDGATGMVP